MFKFFQNILNRASSFKEANLIELVSSSFGNVQVLPKFSLDKAIREDYRKSMWVRLSIDKIAQTITAAKITICDSKGKPVEKHRLLDLFKRPNPELMPSEVWETVWKQSELTGDSFLMKVKVGNQTRELWPLLPDKIRIHTSQQVGQVVSHYEFQAGQNVLKIPPELIMRFRYVDPSDLVSSLSPLESANPNIEIVKAQDEWNFYGTKERFDPNFAVSFDKEMTQDQLTTASKLIKDKFMGAKRKNNPLVLSGATKIEKLSKTASDIDFIGGKKLYREEIPINFGVPPILIGLAENASLNNVREYQRIFWEQTLIPKLDKFVESLTWSFNDELAAGEYFSYDLSHIACLQKDFNAQVVAAQGLFYLGVDLEEINRKLELGLDLKNATDMRESLNANEKDKDKKDDEK